MTDATACCEIVEMKWLTAACQSELQTAEAAPGNRIDLKRDGRRAFAGKGNLPTGGGIAIEVRRQKICIKSVCKLLFRCTRP